MRNASFTKKMKQWKLIEPLLGYTVLNIGGNFVQLAGTATQQQQPQQQNTNTAVATQATASVNTTVTATSPANSASSSAQMQSITVPQVGVSGQNIVMVLGLCVLYVCEYVY